ncbi:hypothetical protein [Gracilimonas tropica]|uniref:hypothetical protein n=1 Tax=Gracilimonas tropica TaxID=454600 RepID=UPI00037A17E7|nr:hypothetical protein [Gracilimonas tropica]
MAKKKQSAKLSRNVCFVDAGGNKYAAIITAGNDERTHLSVFYPGKNQAVPKTVPHYNYAEEGQEHWTVS